MSEDGSERPRARTGAPSAGQTLGAMWLYTVLRIGLFLALWGLLWLARVPGLLAATIAVVLSIPLSYILLSKQRARLAADLEARVIARQAVRHDIDAQLAGEPVQDSAGAEPAESESPGTGRPDRAGPEQGTGGTSQR